VSLRQVWSPPAAGGRWVGSHWPTGGDLLLRHTSRPLEHGPGVPEGSRPGGAETV
jgi:hypothetical protein